MTLSAGRRRGQLLTLPICGLPFISKLPSGLGRALDSKGGRILRLGVAESLELGKEYSAELSQEELGK